MQLTGFGAVIQPLTPRSAVILQYLFNEGAMLSGPVSRSAHEVTVGSRFRLSDRTSLDIGLVENIINYDNGPDFGVHFGISWASE